ncbi:MAG: hypothetical protein RIC29_03830 [Rhodospirillaceae bacterium]
MYDFMSKHVRDLLIALWSGVLTLLLVAPLNAAPEPNYRARLVAAFHLQMTVTELSVPEFTPGECTLQGTVVRVFRARVGDLEEGDEISVPFPCDVNQGDSLYQDLPDPDEIAAASFIEVFLDPGEFSEYVMSEGQYMVIKGPTQDPLCQTEKAGVSC